MNSEVSRIKIRMLTKIFSGHIDLRPSRQSRNRCIWSKTSRYSLHRGWVEFGANSTLTGSRWVSNNYIIRGRRQVQLVGVSELEIRCCSENQHPAEGYGPPWPQIEQPSRTRKKCCLRQKKLGGQYVEVCSVSNSPLTHNPFATISNTVWQVYFSKEVCSFVIIVDFVSACICVWLYMYYGYGTLSTKILTYYSLRF